MQLNSIEEILDDIRLGKPVILMDDENRENEGDLIVAAEKVTPEIVNFMIKEGRGLLCLTLSGERCDYLELPPMVANSDNKSVYGTPFTVSIEAAQGISTGISAQDRAHTIRVAVDPQSKATDIVQPGHIFPLRAKAGGVLQRSGHTEAGCDLTKLAGLKPAAAIIEVINENGTMSRRPELEIFAEKHGLKIGTIADLINYRLANEKTINKQTRTTLKTVFGQFDMTVYNDSATGREHVALTKGYLTPDTVVMVSVHVMEPFRELFNTTTGDGTQQEWQLQQAMKVVADKGIGVIVLLDSKEQRGFSATLEQASQAPQQSLNDSFHTHHTGSQILKDLGVGKMELMCAPERLTGLSEFDLEIVKYVCPTDFKLLLGEQ